MALHREFLVRSDNAGVVAVLNKGHARNVNTNTALQRIYALLAERDMYLHAQYVPSHENIADALSRGDIKAFLAGFPSVSTQVVPPLPSYLSDKLLSL